MDDTMISGVRQIEVVSEDGDQAVETLAQLFDVPVMIARNDHSDHVDNRMWNIRTGKSIIEVLSPLRPGSASRWLERKGPGLYFACYEIPSFTHEGLLRHLLQKQVMMGGAMPAAPLPYKGMWVHPKSSHGMLMELGDCLYAGGWTGVTPGWWEEPSVGPIEQIRQLVAIVRDVDQAASRWEYMFGLPVVWRSKDATRSWAVMSFLDGETFVEFRQPTTGDSAEAEFLATHGEGLYMAMMEVKPDHGSFRDRLESNSSLLPLSIDYDGYEGFGIDPKVAANCRFEVGRGSGENPWPPAGPDWYRHPVKVAVQLPRGMEMASM
jgi:hypothetical protein